MNKLKKKVDADNGSIVCVSFQTYLIQIGSPDAALCKSCFHLLHVYIRLVHLYNMHMGSEFIYLKRLTDYYVVKRRINVHCQGL